MESHDHEDEDMSLREPASPEQVASEKVYNSNLFPEFVITFKEMIDDLIDKGNCLFEFMIPAQLQERLINLLEKCGLEKLTDDARGDVIALLVMCEKSQIDRENEFIKKIRQFPAFQALTPQLPVVDEPQRNIPTAAQDDEIKDGDKSAQKSKGKSDVLRVPTQKINEASIQFGKFFSCAIKCRICLKRTKAF